MIRPSDAKMMKRRVRVLSDDELMIQWTLAQLEPNEFTAGRYAHLETEFKKRNRRKQNGTNS